MSDPLGTLRDFFNEHIRQRYGTLLAGGLCGIGVWAWVDALVLSTTKVRFVEHLPGIAAFLALILINAVRWDEVQGYDPWDEGVYCRSRVWLLLAYFVCGAAVMGAVLVMIGSGGGPLGIACVVEVAAVLGAAMLFFVSRSEGEGQGGAYGSLL